MNDLNDRLLAAHAEGAHDALVHLYAEAADRANDPAAEGFFLTHAYVFALERNHPDALRLKARLVASGREED